MKKIGLLSDTHSFLDQRLENIFSDCDEIWHAGDIGDIRVMDTLESWKPVRAVHGNIDSGTVKLSYPKFIHFTLEDVRILLIHIAGSFGKYNPDVHKIIEEHGAADLLICGHSHILKVQMDKKYRMLYMNPGAAGVHGFHIMRTALTFELDAGEIRNLNIIELGKRSHIQQN